MTHILIMGVLLSSVGLVVGVSTAETDNARAAENRSIVRRIYEEVFNAGKLDQADVLIAAEYIDHNPPGPGGEPGIEGFKRTVRAFRFAFPDMRFTIEELIASGDTVMARTTLHGTHKRAFMGVAPTEKQVTVAGFDIYRIVDGVVVERWGTLDGLTLMQQMDVFIPMAWQYTLLGALTQEERKPLIDEMSEASRKRRDFLKDDRHPITELVHLDQLMHLFQADAGQVRLVALLSPG